MDKRLSLITLGVADVSRARDFYEALGWRADGGVDDETDHVVFFQAGGMIVALWDRGKLADDSAVEDSGGWGGVTLAYNVRSPEEVDAVIDEARGAGATIGRPGAKTFWGGYRVEELARRHRAGVERETVHADEAYAHLPHRGPVPYRAGWLPEDRSGAG